MVPVGAMAAASQHQSTVSTRVLELVGLQRDNARPKFAVHSLRHFCAVMAPTNGIRTYTVSTNMRTSVKIVEHYSGRQGAHYRNAAKRAWRVRLRETRVWHLAGC